MLKKEEHQLRTRLRNAAKVLHSGGLIKHSECLDVLDPVWNTVTSNAGSTEKTLPLVLLSDLIDHIPVSQCSDLISYMESKEASIRPCLQGSLPAKLTFLSLCKKLTSRLTLSQDTKLYGRVVLLSANLLGMFERSGLNLQGDVNLVDTSFDPNDEPAEATASSNEVTTEKDSTSFDLLLSPRAVDYDFYKLFWKFQQYFNEPNAVFEKLDAFSAHLAVILDEFNRNAGMDSSMAPQYGLDSSDNFTARYLTFRRLLNLQLRDNYFRRCVLVQVLILLNSLKHFRTSTTKELSAEQITKLDEIQESVVRCLKLIPPNGAAFTQFILQTLKKEEAWIAWKVDKCPDILSKDAKPETSSLLVKHLAKRSKSASCEEAEEGPTTKKQKQLVMGDANLSKLWEENNILSLKDECFFKRRGVSADEFLAAYQEQAAPGSGVEKEFFLSRNSLYTWRALRILASRHMLTMNKAFQAAIMPATTTAGAARSATTTAQALAPGISERPLYETFEWIIKELSERSQAKPMSPTVPSTSTIVTTATTTVPTEPASETSAAASVSSPSIPPPADDLPAASETVSTAAPAEVVLEVPVTTSTDTSVVTVTTSA